MARKIRIIGITAVLVIILGTVISVGAVQGKNIGDVERAKALSVSESEVELSWKNVKSAEGYYIYVSPHNKNEFKRIAEIKAEELSKNPAKVNELNQATDYDFYVTAFKHDKDNVVESENHEVFCVQTAPKKQSVKLASPDEGLLNISWKKNEKANGYVVEYVQGKSFENATVEKFADAGKTSLKIEKLKVNEDYSVRACSYIENNGEILYGDWSATQTIKIAEKIEMPSNIDPTKPMIALTFDDGPGYNSASDKILDVLEKYGARATFFMLGQNAEDHPKNVKRKVELGCEIGNHTYNHKHYGKNVEASDIVKASNAIKKAGGVPPKSFRSPGGNTNDSIRSECKKLGMPLYYWSLDTQDWKYRDADRVYKAVINNVEDGDIILMHEIYDSTAEAVERMVPKLIEMGYQLVTCEELVQAKTGKNPEAGTQYVNATTIKNTTA